MNKRIFELAKQADLIQWDTLPSGARTPDHESVVKAKKFAELIVSECINSVIANGNSQSAADYDRGYIDGQSFSLKCIKKHFGVEE
jgi:hypothetical protein